MLLDTRHVKCAVCGAENRIFWRPSYSRFGFGYLDTRPTAMARVSFFLSRCKQCGYVNTNISCGDGALREFINSEKYKTCDGINPSSDMAKSYIQYALIHEYIGGEKSVEYTFLGFLNAAWMCDDHAAQHRGHKKPKRDAIICRKRCLELIDRLIADEPDIDNKEIFMQIKADLLRRTEQFDALISEYLNKTFQNRRVNQVIKFELDLVRAGDTKIYKTDNIDCDKYPL